MQPSHEAPAHARARADGCGRRRVRAAAGGAGRVGLCCLKAFILSGLGDILFFCNRKVAATLLEEVLNRMLALKGTEQDLMPINYESLLDSELEDTDFFVLNYPCS